MWKNDRIKEKIANNKFTEIDWIIHHNQFFKCYKCGQPQDSFIDFIEHTANNPVNNETNNNNTINNINTTV